ncbi:hypothetical protein GKKCFE_06825 [Pseudomonas sp. E141]|uniref:hypothetical protein n=1 Tax=Pseudomonas sp. E141 TaxID=2875961 RepID=UPI004046796A
MDGLIFFVVSCFILLTLAMGSSFFSKKEGLFSTFFVFSTGAMIYFYLIPLEFTINGAEGYVKHGFFVEVSNIANFVVFEYLLSIVFFAIAIFMTKLPVSSVRRLGPECVSFSFFRLIIITALFLYFFRAQILLTLNAYEQVAQVAYSNQLYSLIKYVLLLNFSVMGVLLVSANKQVAGWFCLAVPIFAGLITSDKNPILIFLISMGIIFLNGKIKLRSFCLYALVGLPLIYLILNLIFAFSFWRAGFDIAESLNMSYENFSFSRIDPAGPFVSISISVDTDEYKLGGTYLDNLQQFLPKFISSERPPGISDAFAIEMIPAWVEGQGLGYSPLAEAINNFGYFAFIHFFILGLYWGIMWKVFIFFGQRWLSFDVCQVFYKIYGFYLLMVGFRVDSLHFMKVAPLYVILGFICLMVFTRVKK